MKKLIQLGLLLLLVVLIVGCNGKTRNTAEELNTQSNLEQVTLKIEGMTCQSCALGVEAQLKQVEGVVDVQVSYTNGTGMVTFDSAKIKPDEIAAASTIYPAKVIK